MKKILPQKNKKRKKSLLQYKISLKRFFIIIFIILDLIIVYTVLSVFYVNPIFPYVLPYQPNHEGIRQISNLNLQKFLLPVLIRKNSLYKTKPAVYDRILFKNYLKKTTDYGYIQYVHTGERYSVLTDDQNRVVITPEQILGRIYFPAISKEERDGVLENWNKFTADKKEPSLINYVKMFHLFDIDIYPDEKSYTDRIPVEPVVNEKLKYEIFRLTYDRAANKYITEILPIKFSAKFMQSFPGFNSGYFDENFYISTHLHDLDGNLLTANQDNQTSLKRENANNGDTSYQAESFNRKDKTVLIREYIKKSGESSYLLQNYQGKVLYRIPLINSIRKIGYSYLLDWEGDKFLLTDYYGDSCGASGTLAWWQQGELLNRLDYGVGCAPVPRLISYNRILKQAILVDVVSNQQLSFNIPVYLENISKFNVQTWEKEPVFDLTGWEESNVKFAVNATQTKVYLIAPDVLMEVDVEKGTSRNLCTLSLEKAKYQILGMVGQKIIISLFDDNWQSSSIMIVDTESCGREKIDNPLLGKNNLKIDVNSKSAEDDYLDFVYSYEE